MKKTAENNNVILLIIDGFGVAPPSKGNAVTLANTPNWNRLKEKYSYTELHASGKHVGLPDNIMGNSEVGHLTIGTGRLTFQSLELINRACEDGSLANNPEILNIAKHLDVSKGSLHLMGLLSDGGVHSHQKHLEKLIDIFSDTKVKQIWIHAFTDGRDTPPDSSVIYLQKLQDKITSLPQCKLSTIIGRYFVMDRDNKWDRTKIAYDMLVNMKGSTVDDPVQEIYQRYLINETDEFLKPIIYNPKGKIQSGDAILFFNFRADRARQITASLNGHGGFDTNKFDDLYYATMTSYDGNWEYPVLFHQNEIKDSLAEVISKSNLHQTHISETEKYAHVTYFFNGGQEKPFKNENRILIPSLKIATYDMQPEMKTNEICKNVIKIIEKGGQNIQNFIVLNIAAPDMVGHTGDINATIKAIEIMDEGIHQIYEVGKSNNYVLIIISDHGNSEQMLSNGNPHTAHTTNQVPFLITIEPSEIKLKEDGGLVNIAPTILQLLKIKKPEIMNGESLLL